jgi:ABC-type multidrug transport system ATPase subunit
MSDKILKALIQLFAIIGKPDEIHGSASRNTVALFLKQALNSEQVNEYLELYDYFLTTYDNKSDGEKRIKKTAVSSVKVLVICEQINEALTQKQKILVLVRLIEYIHASNEVDEQEFEFISTVYSSFRISDEEFELLYNFITQHDAKDHESMLIVSEKIDTNYTKSKVLKVEHLQGELRIVHVQSVDVYFVKYFGVMELSLNGNSISDYRIYQLNSGASIRSSKILPIYYSDIISCFLNASFKNPISFKVKQIEYDFSDGHKGLHALSFEENSGKLIGIMGGSGAGKSTLLNILNGNTKPSKGSVTINGIDLHQDKAKLAGVIGFVSQDDLLIEDLTVYQNLYFNAQLCFSNWSDEKIVAKVLQTLHDLGLFDVKDLRVGSPLDKMISGGQRKRLNIALELIREPGVLFVDEPTSGLSSRDSEIIIDLLKTLALKGKVVFVVIHQPSSDIFKVFDKLLILDKGGYTIYLGNPVDGVSHFKNAVNYLNPNENECILCGNVNPEQIFNIIETRVLDENGMPTNERKISPKEWNAIYLKEHQAEVNDTDNVILPIDQTFKKPSLFKQFSVFVKRDVLSKLNNTQYLLINALEAPVLAFILAFMTRYQLSNEPYTFYHNKNLVAYIFMSVIVALFLGLTVSAEEIFKDRKIRKREAFLNLSRGAYLFSKIFILFVISAIQTLFFVAIGNYIIGFQEMFFEYWMMLFTVSLFANALGLNISSAFKSAVTIYIIIPFLIIPQLLLSGLLVKFDELNPSLAAKSIVPKSGEIMASRWAFEALVVNQFKNNYYQKNIYPFEKEIINASFNKGLWYNKMMDLLNNKDAISQQIVKNELHNVGFKGASAKQIDIEAAKSFLATIKQSNVEVYKKYTALLDNYYIQNGGNEAQKQALERAKNKYHNARIEELVKNSRPLEEGIYVESNRLHPNENNIYFNASNKHQIRSHFYAPKKYFAGNYYDTYIVNLLVIIGMTISCLIALYYNLLKKLINGIQNLAFKIKLKKST